VSELSNHLTATAQAIITKIGSQRLQLKPKTLSKTKFATNETTSIIQPDSLPELMIKDNAPTTTTKNKLGMPIGMR
jgi:hypothetical protein